MVLAFLPLDTDKQPDSFPYKPWPGTALHPQGHRGLADLAISIFYITRTGSGISIPNLHAEIHPPPPTADTLFSASLQAKVRNPCKTILLTPAYLQKSKAPDAMLAHGRPLIGPALNDGSSAMSNIPSTRHPIRDLIFLYNPVYLLSSVCMLVGCVLLTNDTEHKVVPLGQLLAIVAAVGLYQACLFLIGSFLAFGRRILRDGRTLLILDAIFLSDITFVNSELLTTNLTVGLGIGLLLFGLSALRIHWITRRAQCPMPLHRYLIILMQLMLIIGIPAYLKYVDTGTSIGATTLYCLWWAVGLALAGTVLADHARQVVHAKLPPRAAWVQPTYLGVTWLSLILHLAELHYVYNVTFHAAMLCPILISLAMLLRHRDGRVPSRHRTVGLQLAMLIMTFLIGVDAADSLSLSLLGASVSAGKLTFGALYLAAVYMYIRPLAYWLIGAGALVAATDLFGPGWRQIGMCIIRAGRWAVEAAVNLLPSTRLGWGITGIVGAFLLLGIGLLISLRKPPDDHHPADHATPEPGPTPLAGDPSPQTA